MTTDSREQPRPSTAWVQNLFMLSSGKKHTVPATFYAVQGTASLGSSCLPNAQLRNSSSMFHDALLNGVCDLWRWHTNVRSENIIHQLLPNVVQYPGRMPCVARVKNMPFLIIAQRSFNTHPTDKLYIIFIKIFLDANGFPILLFMFYFILFVWTLLNFMYQYWQTNLGDKLVQSLRNEN
jgi:hypothetical protein